MLRTAIIFFLIAAASASAQNSSAQKQDSIRHTAKMTITEVLEKYTDKWMKIRGVQGTAEGRKNDKACIIIMVDHITPTNRKRIPKSVDSYDVVIEETGAIKAR
ncbi:MAG TPA: hypothetical protein VEW28_09900 [Candidatus Kapabacteria bacterium]|nr:hypothetical protein [Candidatus Kapabacteria bacterium]